MARISRRNRFTVKLSRAVPTCRSSSGSGVTSLTRQLETKLRVLGTVYRMIIVITASPGLGGVLYQACPTGCCTPYGEQRGCGGAESIDVASRPWDCSCQNTCDRTCSECVLEDKSLTSTAMWVLRLDGVMGLAFFFPLGILVKECTDRRFVGAMMLSRNYSAPSAREDRVRRRAFEGDHGRSVSTKQREPCPASMRTRISHCQ